jgi:glycerophosphoryl diester phosphodiesterase
MAATESGALFVIPRWEALPGARLMLSPDWIRRVHKAGLGIISWPVRDGTEIEDLQRMGMDIIWQ